MWKHLLVQASYQLTILFLVIYGGPKYLSTYKLASPCTTYSNVDGHVSLALADSNPSFLEGQDVLENPALLLCTLPCL